MKLYLRNLLTYLPEKCCMIFFKSGGKIYDIMELGYMRSRARIREYVWKQSLENPVQSIVPIYNVHY